MTTPRTTSSAARILGAAVLMSAFGGCSPGDVQLEGKIFDAVGIGSNSKKSSEPVMAARSPIVLPPNVERLPQPGKQDVAESSELAAISDPDKKLEVNQAELQKQQAEFCKVNYERPVQNGDDTVDDVAGPLGTCRGSVLNVVGLGLGKSEDK